MTPFKAVYGRDPPTLVKYVPTGNDPISIHDQLLQRNYVLARLKQNLQKAQQYMKKYVDQKRRLEEWKVGDMVLVKLQPSKQHSIALRKNQ